MTTHRPPAFLSLDTGTSLMSVALTVGERRKILRQNCGTRQSEHILPAVRSLLREYEITPADLTAVIYNRGPGMFTGLRLGIAMAQGLSAPFDIPLIGVPALDATAAQLPDCPSVLAAIDARMNEIFYAWFDTRSWRRLGEYRVDKRENIKPPAEVDINAARGAGNAFVEPLCGIAGITSAADAGHYLDLALSGRYPGLRASEASLLYVRDKVALTAREQAQRREGQE